MALDTVDAMCKLMAGGLARVRPWVRARISKHNGDSRSSDKQIGEEEGSATLHASGLLWPLDCAVHDQFGGVATEERWVGAKAPGGDATAEKRGCPVVLGRGRWRVVGRRASQETDRLLGT